MASNVQKCVTRKVSIIRESKKRHFFWQLARQRNTVTKTMLQVMISAACAASMAYFFCSHHGALVLSPVRALTISSSSSGVSTMSTSMGCPRSLCMSCMCCKMLSLMCNKVCGTEYLAGLGRWLEPLWCWLQRSTLNFRLLETFYGANDAKMCLAWFAVFAAFWACACHPWNGLAPAPPFWPKKSPKLKSKPPVVLPLLCPDLSPAGSLLSQSKWRPHRVHAIWLQPPFFSMGAWHLGHRRTFSPSKPGFSHSFSCPPGFASQVCSHKKHMAKRFPRSL